MNVKLPKAVIVVHLYGLSVKSNELMSIFKKFNLSLIEDTGEPFGSKYNQIQSGIMGE